MVNSIGSNFFDPGIARALAPAQPASAGEESLHRHDQPVTARAVVAVGEPRIGLENRAGLLYQHNLADDGINAKTRQALRAYRTLEDAEEREQVSRMLGVDEYA